MVPRIGMIALFASLAVGCIPDSVEDVATGQVSEDLRCPRADIQMLDEIRSPTSAAFRFFACRQDVVYTCQIVRPRRHEQWACARDRSFRFAE
jgi:hypothetical protein